MRAFISLNLSEETRLTLKEFQKSTKDVLGFADSKKVKWEASDKFHITMFFIGEIDDAKAEELKDGFELIRAENIGALSFEVKGLNAFPNLHKPRVIYAEVYEKEGKLNKLNEAINRMMKSFGFEHTVNFNAHITLGRVKRYENLQAKNLGKIEIKNNFEISKLCFMKSTLNSNGAVHEEVFNTDL